jgi:hypothetical protein
MITIKIKDFSATPGHRSREDGPFSGDQFLDEVLRPRYQEAVNSKQKLLVDLDGTAGYATSFLEASFGGLAREYDIQDLLQNMEFKSEAEPYLPEEIRGYIRGARRPLYATK